MWPWPNRSTWLSRYWGGRAGVFCNSGISIIYPWPWAWACDRCGVAMGMVSVWPMWCGHGDGWPWWWEREIIFLLHWKTKCAIFDDLTVVVKDRDRPWSCLAFPLLRFCIFQGQSHNAMVTQWQPHALQVSHGRPCCPSSMHTLSCVWRQLS